MPCEQGKHPGNPPTSCAWCAHDNVRALDRSQRALKACRKDADELRALLEDANTRLQAAATALGEAIGE